MGLAVIFDNQIYYNLFMLFVLGESLLENLPQVMKQLTLKIVKPV